MYNFFLLKKKKTPLWLLKKKNQYNIAFMNDSFEYACQSVFQ